MRIWGGIFDVELKEKELVQLEQRMTASDFWDDNESARETVDKVASFKNIINPYRSLCKEVEDFLALAELVFEEGAESEFLEEADEAWQSLEEGLEKLELFSFLKGKHDAAGAFLSINAGAGGTESCDWANMLYRMYTRWVERHDMKYEIIDYQAGDEAGIKSVTIRIMGENAFGFLRSERGVHRLVRISPFDSNKRRHTSFCSVDVVPELDDSIEIDIEDKDLKIDTYRASGAGGQHVNTTDSAVRITHIPSGVVVSCQMERSQHKNRATAMKMLSAQLYELEQQKLQAEIDANNATKSEIGWGSQIRSYVLHPYKMIKDLRTSHETSNVNHVLDGDLDKFQEAFLRSEYNVAT